MLDSAADMDRDGCLVGEMPTVRRFTVVRCCKPGSGRRLTRPMKSRGPE